ncbi:hypothetical protein [Actinoplanes sp. NPDC051494]|uniref:hypothetical protein n=1 Tax=Actinoplanes sp. NPDC051494 TaxID=3363907 RepID=UPI0037A10F4B
MTDTHPTTNGPDDDTKAKAFFTTALLVGAGFAGLAVAGIVLGFDYLLHGEPHERERLAQQRAEDRRNRYEHAAAWLENDRAERSLHRQAVREWFTADPETRGDKPSSGETAGRVFGRSWNNLLVGWRRFKTGWNKGRQDARSRRDQGEQRWWRRPDEPDKPAPIGNPETEQPHSAEARRPGPDPQPKSQTTPGRHGKDTEIVDAEIVPDQKPPTTREVVPVGDNPTAGPDPRADEYQRRLDELDSERQHNGHRPEPTPMP